MTDSAEVKKTKAEREIEDSNRSQGLLEMLESKARSSKTPWSSYVFFSLPRFSFVLHLLA